MTQTDSRFEWVGFYMEFADKLLAYKDDRGELLRKVLPAIYATGAPYALTDKFMDGTSGPLRDICPFTLMSTFNRDIKPENRIAIARALGKVLGVNHEAPEEFRSIPIVLNMNSWFFGFERDRKPGDIDALWQVFQATCALADSDTESTREAFITSYDLALKVDVVRMNLSIHLSKGLYWIRPNFFVARDKNNRAYIKKHFPHPLAGEAKLTGDAYLQLRDHVVERLGVAGIASIHNS